MPSAPYRLTSKLKRATFRVVHFPSVNRFVAIAWNYNEAVLISTSDHETYTAARAELDKLCAERNVKLQWFDGEYSHDVKTDLLVPIDTDRRKP